MSRCPDNDGTSCFLIPLRLCASTQSLQNVCSSWFLARFPRRINGVKRNVYDRNESPILLRSFPSYFLPNRHFSDLKRTSTMPSSSSNDGKNQKRLCIRWKNFSFHSYSSSERKIIFKTIFFILLSFSNVIYSHPLLRTILHKLIRGLNLIHAYSIHIYIYSSAFSWGASWVLDKFPGTSLWLGERANK